MLMESFVVGVAAAIHYRNPAVAVSMALNLDLPSIRLTIMIKSI